VNQHQNKPGFLAFLFSKIYYLYHLCLKLTLNSAPGFKLKLYLWSGKNFMAKVYLSTGSNQGDRLAWLVTAAQHINQQVGAVIHVSPVVESEPWGFDAETTFYNQVLLVETVLSAKQVLIAILDIEKTLGRVRSGTTYSSRNIDIDILIYDQQKLETPDLIIPHPLLHKRGFVLVPLAMLAPELVHPVLKIPVLQLLLQLQESGTVKVVTEASNFFELLKTTKQP
jgi:2-amino-4-hydroxy-6-hydroxymethyldihydropteridine diphosphokinase